MKPIHSALLVAGLLSVSLSTLVVSDLAAQSAAPKAKATASAPTWPIDARQSRIAFSTRWAGQAVNGNFRQWSGDIKFDPANLAASKAIVTIQTGSALTGMKEPDENIGGGDWFDARRFPTARYETTAIRSLGNNRYVADGLLTIKGVSYRLALPFTVTIAGNVATMTGQATLDRMTLKLGLESDASAEWVARETVVNVAVRATRR
jgi:polyisoprenoid-binding protein YceI